jgi:AcrR family transcriptional regulator
VVHPDTAPRRRRADAQRNVGALIEAARTVFATSGVDAPAKEITDLAGVGVGTLYRHFPQRSDLVKAVVESGIDAIADAGPALSAAREPAEALSQWMHRFTELLATKRGLASALHSGDPAFAGLPGYFLQRLGPTLAALLDAAVADGTVRDDISAEDLLHAITQLSQPVPGRGPAHNQHIVAVFIDGLRCGARPTSRGAAASNMTCVARQPSESLARSVSLGSEPNKPGGSDSHLRGFPAIIAL